MEHVLEHVLRDGVKYPLRTFFCLFYGLKAAKFWDGFLFREQEEILRAKSGE
jgi:hypothetical protein